MSHFVKFFLGVNKLQEHYSYRISRLQKVNLQTLFLASSQIYSSKSLFNFNYKCSTVYI